MKCGVIEHSGRCVLCLVLDYGSPSLCSVRLCASKVKKCAFPLTYRDSACHVETLNVLSYLGRQKQKEEAGMATIALESVEIFGSGVLEAEGVVIDREGNAWGGGRN